MAYPLVGVMGAVTTGASPITPAFAQPTTAGNLLIAWAVSSVSGAAIVASGGWFTAARSSAQSGAVVFFYANCSASQAAPTFTLAGTTLWAALAEFSGGAIVSPLDKTGVNNGVTTSPVVATASAADTASGRLVVTTGGHVLSMSGTTVTADTYNNGATPTGNLNNDATSGTIHYRFAWGLTTGNSAANQTSQSDTSGNIQNLGAAIASFQLGAASAAAVIPDVGMALTVT